MGRRAWGVGKKKVPKKNQPGLRKGPKKKGQLEFATLVNPGTGRDEKGPPISAPSIHVGALVGAGLGFRVHSGPCAL
jgi:hypothetical protein